MTTPERATDYLSAATSEYAAAINANLDEDDNLAAIKDRFGTRMDAKFLDGTYTATPEQVMTLLRETAWRQVDEAAGHRTQQVLEDLFHGVVALDGIDEYLDAPIKVGKHRRSMLRHVRESDLTRMVEARAENLARAHKAYLTFEEAAQWLKGLVVEHGSVSAAITAGTVRLRRSDS